MASQKHKSKRQSAGKHEQLQLDDFILYLDENLDNCKPIASALELHGVRYERHQAHFPRGEQDEVWLPFVAERQWIVLTKDKRNRYNELERRAVRRYEVREFYFGSGNFTGAEMAAALVSAIPHMRRICGAEGAPIVGSINKSGQITIVFDKHGSTHERRKAARGRAQSADTGE